MTKEQEVVRSVFDAYIRDAKASSTKKDRPTFDMLEKVMNRAIKALEQNEELQKENEDFRDYIDKVNHTNSQLIQLIEKHKMNKDTSNDCVSRAEIIDELNRLGRNTFKDDTDYDNFFAFVDSLPPVTPTFPKGATNGDVIKAMFPNIEADEIKTNTGGYIEVKYLDTTDKRDATAFRKSWWNAPYKRGDLDGSN